MREIVPLPTRPSAAVSRRPVGSRVAHGAIAGICGTMAMTVAMRLLVRRLAAEERYPLPPREIVERMAPRPLRDQASESLRQDSTLLAHFGYGAAAGALYAAMADRTTVLGGSAYGVAVWVGSYLGWIPAARVLSPATDHPRRRNALMVAVHLVWGGALAGCLRELDHAANSIFATGAVADRPRQPSLPGPRSTDTQRPGQER